MGSTELDHLGRDFQDDLDDGGMGFLGPIPGRLEQDVVLNNGRVIRAGSPLADMHFSVHENAFEKWRSLSPAERGRKAAEITLDGLITLAEILNEEPGAALATPTIHGASHMIKPHFFQILGFTVRVAGEKDAARVLDYTRTRLDVIYGFDRWGQMPAGKVYEFFATPGQMIDALPKLIDSRDRIAGRAPSSIGK